MKRFHRPLALLFAVFLVSCGATTTPTKSALSSPKYKPYINEHQSAELARRSVDRAQVACFGDDCHDSVAMLISSDGVNTSRCTGFLIAPNLIATNSHCISSELKKTPDACANLSIVFPDTTRYKADRVNCAKVEFTSGEKEEASRVHVLDYAVVRLEHAVARPVLKLSRKGLGNEDEDFTVYKVNPNPDTSSGWMQKISCKPALRTVIMPNYIDAHAPIAVLGDCEVKGGNSGSPIIDSDGRVRGILYGTLQPDFAHFASQRIGTTLAPVALVSNWACFTAPALEEVEGKITDVCPQKSSVMLDETSTTPIAGSAEMAALALKVAAYKVAASVWIKSSPANRFEWHEIIESKGLNQSYKFSPKCLKRDLSWLDEYAWLNIGFLKAFHDKAELHFDIPTLTKKTQFDRYFRPDLYFLQETKPLDLTFYPEELSKNAANMAIEVHGLESRDRNWLTDMFTSKQTSLPMCEK